MKYMLSAAVVALAMSSVASVEAAEVTLVAPGGIRAAVEQMIPAFEQKTGHKVKATFGSGLGTKAQVTKGDAFDVPIVQPPYPEVLASGNVVASSETPLAHVFVGVAVRPGMPKPDISNAEAVKKMLLAAKSISYPNPAGGAGAMAMLAKGEVDIGLTFVSEISTPTSLSGFVSAHAKAPGAAKALLGYLSSADAAKVYRERGMVPGR